MSMAFDDSGLYSSYYNPYHISRLQAEIEASAQPTERRCVCCLLMFGATCGAVTVAVGFYVHTPAITWPVVVVGLLGVILGVVLAHRQATGRGWNAGSASIYRLGALVLRRRQEQEEEEEEAQRRAQQAQQAQPPWPPQPLQPWRVAQVVGSRYYMPVYCACPLDDAGSGSGSGSGSVVDGYDNQQVQKLTRQQKQVGVAQTETWPVGAEEGGGGCGDGSLRLLSPSDGGREHRGVVSVEMGAVGGAGGTASGSGSSPATSSGSGSGSSRCSSSQDLAGKRAGGGGVSAGGAGPVPGPHMSVCGWAGEGAMVCGLPLAGVDGRVDVRPVLVLQPHWQHPAHPQHHSQQHPVPLQQQEQTRPEAQPPHLPLQPEEEEEWADAASEAEAGACGGDGGGLGVPQMMSSASQQQHRSGGDGDLAGSGPLAVPAAAAAAAAARSGSGAQ